MRACPQLNLISENLSLVLQLFLDDSVRNIIAGKEMGLHTVLVILLIKVDNLLASSILQ